MTTDLILIGAGLRGADSYASYALEHPTQARFVAVAEPDPERRERFATLHRIPAERRFVDWQELLALPQLGAGALVCTQDRQHVGPAVAAMRAGYDVLLEKPMAPDRAGCVELTHVAEQTGRRLLICHVLRYTPFFRALNQVLLDGRIGEIVDVAHRENVVYWHMAHSFVRGNWRNTAFSNPMILAKCCHDLDILVWNLARPVQRLSSWGSLLEFRPDRAAVEIPARCTDGCPIERECQYSAIKLYLECRPWPALAEQYGAPGTPPIPPSWPFSALSSDTSYAGRLAALRHGPYGRCVYRADNDVVDHQVVSMQLEGGATATLTMHGHAHEEQRTMRYDGTRGTLRAVFGHRSAIEIHNHRSGRVEPVPIAESTSGHGGGDWGMMRSFVDVLNGREQPLTGARESLESHLLAFAAEEAREHGKVVEMQEYRARAGAAER